jgi:hypothetical protein
MFDWQSGSPENAVEIIVGMNWSDRDINQMVREYYEENVSELFNQ